MTSGRPYWLGIGTSAIGAIWLWQASLLPQTAQYAALGPGFFVTIVGLGLVILGAILTMQIARGETFEPQEAEDAETDAPASRSALGLAVAGAALPLLFIKILGFPLTAAGSFFLVAVAFGSRRYLLSLAIGLALGFFCWYGFGALGVRLGPISPLLGG